MKIILRILKSFFTNYYAKNGKISAFARFLKWQLVSRIMPYPIALPFVNNTFLLTTSGMSGATGNYYFGLAEYEEMSFVLYSLQKGDLFVDVGANIGSYSILAASLGAEVISVEPIKSTFISLKRNILLNDFSDRIKSFNIGLGKETGELTFSVDLDTMNHVLANDDSDLKLVKIPIQRLDDLLGGKVPTLIKIDVEGFETEVVKGAEKTLSSPNLKAVIMELNGSGARYGFNEDDLFEKMQNFQFNPCKYNPKTRSLIQLEKDNKKTQNIIFSRIPGFLENSEH